MVEGNSPAPGAELNVEVTTPVFGGETLGRLPDGRAILVPYAIAGERLKVRITELRRGYARGEPLEVLEPSPLRRPARCRHFGECGGCHYQHLDYDRQLELKREILRAQLVRIAGLAEPPLEPAVPSPTPWNYRNHVQFHLAADGAPGFQALRSHRIVPLVECHLPEAPLNALWPRLSGPPAGPPSGLPWAGVQRLILRADSAGRRLVILEARPGGPGDLPPAAGAEGFPGLPPELQSAAFCWHRPAPGAGGSAGVFRRLWGEATLQMQVLGEAFRLSPLSFFQVNTGGTASLVREVLECSGDAPARHALDLYCGVGLFSRFLASRADRLTGVELSPSACADFRANLTDRDKVRLIEGDVAATLAALREAPDLVVADPPRAGLGPRVIGLLARRRPRRLVYVSCDPATLARDAALLGRGGWTLRRVVPVDLFPQTAHIESVSLWQ